GQRLRAEVRREPAAVQALQRGPVRQQRDPAAGGGRQLPGRGGGQHAALGVSGDDQPPAGVLRPGGDPPGQVGHRPLRVAGRGEGVGGARPEGADVPQDADGAPRGGVLVGAPPPGDEQYEAEPDQPGAQRLRGLGGPVDDGVRAAGGLAGCPVGDQGADEGSRAQQQGGAGGDGDDARAAVGEGGQGAGVGDAAGAGGVGLLAGVVAGDGGALRAGEQPGPPGQPAG